ncbi:MAG TPA: DUF6159 family protein [Steroidobacteraceae bacterium]
MFDRLERGIELLQASWAFLRKHRGLLVFPVLSSMAVLLLLASFVLPMGGMDTLAAQAEPTYNQKALFVLFYLCQCFVMFFFNAALIGAIMMQLDGETPTVSGGLRIAASKVGPIFVYSLIAATVGLILHLLRERLGFVERLVVGLIGVSWTLATYLVVPVLVFRQRCGPIEAILESAELFKKTWGEGVMGATGLGVVFAIIFLVEALCGIALISFARSVTDGAFLVVLLEIILVGVVALTVLVQVTLSGIYHVALFRYANGFSAVSGFDPDVLGQAFEAP